MQIQIIREPTPAIIFDNFFGTELNKKIFDEAIALESYFEDATTIGKIHEMRVNQVCYYDNVYDSPVERVKSPLLKALNKKFQSEEFRDILSSFAFPITEFPITNNHETQVSRYGNDKEFYKWHIDRLENNSRLVSLVYWFCRYPRKFKGGNIAITNSPITRGKLVEKSPKVLDINYKNDRAVVIGSTTPHTVYPTTSPKEFAAGRFSVNCWIGFRVQ